MCQGIGKTHTLRVSGCLLCDAAVGEGELAEELRQWRRRG